MSYKEVRKRIENYNNKYVTDEEIIELMEEEIKEYRNKIKKLEHIKEEKEDNKKESVTTQYYADGNLIRKETVYYYNPPYKPKNKQSRENGERGFEKYTSYLTWGVWLRRCRYGRRK